MIPPPVLRLGSRTLATFTFCGIIGVVAAMVLSLTLTAHRQLPLHVMLAIIAAAIATFFAVILVTKVITGEEQIIYYHHEIAVLVVAAIVAAAFGAPVRPYLDATILGIGAFLFCGRVGCLFAGCCHGRPSRFGITYGAEHVARGFTWYYEGVRLFPLQLVEAFWALGVVVFASRAILLDRLPYGGGLALYIVAYDCARFALELFRGDPERPYTFGLSQAQWISFWLTLGVVVAELRGVLPLSTAHVLALVALSAAMIVMMVRRAPDYLGVHHVRELAPVVTAPLTSSIALTRTSRGLCVSASEVQDTPLFAFSSPTRPLTRRRAASLARLVSQLRREPRAPRLIEGNGGVYEVVFVQSSSSFESASALYARSNSTRKTS